MRSVRCLLALMACLGLAACSMSEDTSLASEQVPGFHKALNQGDFERIYSGSSEELKESADRKRFIELLEAVHRKLGLMKTTSQEGWHVSYQSGAAYVTLTFTTEYEHGEATEQLVYVVRDGVARLGGYHIASHELMVR